MHRTVERSIILSEDVRKAAGAEGDCLVSVGRYMLRGVATPIELFTLYDPDAGAVIATDIEPPEGRKA